MLNVIMQMLWRRLTGVELSTENQTLILKKNLHVDSLTRFSSSLTKLDKLERLYPTNSFDSKAWAYMSGTAYCLLFQVYSPSLDNRYLTNALAYYAPSSARKKQILIKAKV